MSGGVAYVWNPNGDFDYFCNMEMVELSLIEDMADNRELYRLIGNHYKHTHSQLAGTHARQLARICGAVHKR